MKKQLEKILTELSAKVLAGKFKVTSMDGNVVKIEVNSIEMKLIVFNSGRADFYNADLFGCAQLELLCSPEEKDILGEILAPRIEHLRNDAIQKQIDELKKQLL